MDNQILLVIKLSLAEETTDLFFGFNICWPVSSLAFAPHAVWLCLRIVYRHCLLRFLAGEAGGNS